MILASMMARLNQRYQEEPMPCKNCTCSKPCGHLDYDDDFPFEADKSALGTQQEKWLTSSSTYLERLCSLEPGAVECKTYED